jgi:hypothetical protein
MEISTNVETAECGTGSRCVGDGERIGRDRRQRSLRIVDELQGLVAGVFDGHYEVEVGDVGDGIWAFSTRRQREVHSSNERTYL